MTTSTWRGHKIYCIGDKWFYSDNDIAVYDDKNRACGHCGKEQTEEGHDSCIGTLPGVLNACCGHGVDNDAYIQFEGYTYLRGIDAVEYLNKQRINRMSNKLRECPFCGLKENLVLIQIPPIDHLGDDQNLEAIHCDNCGLTMHHSDKSMMYYGWNTRHGKHQ